ncbi:uncharacterized protein LOC135463763 [Liolophura sinensis]|uniref:uncharacterized protein LOC135463763 n=1 Tax=Liolophura sinensis TaxID=3198878 RepID=UPI003158F736
MPRRRATLSPSHNRPAAEESEFEAPVKKTKLSDSADSETVKTEDSPGPDGDTGSVQKGVSSQNQSSGGDQSVEKRNLSLEALFQVTDNELQNISRVSPSESALGDGDVDHMTITVRTTDEDDDQTTQRVVVIPVSEKGVEKYQLKSDSLEEQGLKLVYTKQTYDQFEPNPISYGTFKPRSFKSHQQVVDKLIQRVACPSEAAGNVGRKRKHPSKLGKHICPYCGRGCAKPSVLQKHIRAHTGERPFPCAACGFSFKTKSNLYKHCKSRAHALKAGLASNLQNVFKDATAEDGTSEDVGVESDDTGSEAELAENDSDASGARQEKVDEQQTYVSLISDGSIGQEVSIESNEQQYAILDTSSDKIILWHANEQAPIQIADPKPSDTEIHVPVFLPQLDSSQVVKIGEPPVLYQPETSRPAEASLSAPCSVYTAAPGFEANGGQSDKSSNSLDRKAIVKTYLIALPKSATSVVPSLPENLTSQKSTKDSPSFALSSAPKDIPVPSEVSNSAEIICLPHPNCEPLVATKALRELEEISDRVASATNDGAVVPTAVRLMPDKSVHVTIQMPAGPNKNQQTEQPDTLTKSAVLSEENVSLERPASPNTKHVAGSGLVVTLPLAPQGSSVAGHSTTHDVLSGPKPLGVDPKNLTNEMLKERIQQLISENAAIVDTPMADPPRHKRLSRQNSEVNMLSGKQELSTVPHTIVSTKAQVTNQAVDPVVTSTAKDELLDQRDNVKCSKPTTSQPFLQILRQGSVSETGNKSSGVDINSSSKAASKSVAKVKASSSNQEIKIQIRLAKDSTSLSAVSSTTTVTTPPMIGQPGVQFPGDVDQNTVTLMDQTSATSTFQIITSNEGSIIKNLLAKGPIMSPALVARSSSVDQSRFTSDAEIEPEKGQVGDPVQAPDQYGPFQCDKCSVSFKMAQTLSLHKLCYCRNLSISEKPNSDSAENPVLVESTLREEIIAKYFPPSSNVSEDGASVGKKDSKDPHRTLKRKLSRSLSKDTVKETLSHMHSHDKTKIESVTDSKTGNPVSVSLTSAANPVLLASLQQTRAPFGEQFQAAGPSTTQMDAVKIGQPFVSIKRRGEHGKELRLNTAIAAAAAATSSPIMTPMSTSGTPQTPQTPGTPNSSTCLLKLKLKGKLLMKRSMSVERMLSQERGNNSPVKAGTTSPWHMDTGLTPSVAANRPTETGDNCSEDKRAPLKKRRLKEAGLLNAVDKRPLLLRTESAPCVPIGERGDASDLLFRESKSSGKQISEKGDCEAIVGDGEMKPGLELSNKTESVSVPVVKAQLVINPVQLSSVLLRPLTRAPLCGIIATTISLEPFPGFCITLPAISGPATIGPSTHHLHMKANNLSSCFGKSIVPGSPAKIPVLKTPVSPKGIFGINSVADLSADQGRDAQTVASSSGSTATMTVVTPTSTSSGLSSSTQEKPVTPLYLYGHSFPSLRGSTHATYCCIQRLQPMYVRQGTNKKISMYSNWRVAPQNSNPFGLTPKMLLNLYASRYTSNPVYKESVSPEFNSGILTHSTYWDFYSKHGIKEQTYVRQTSLFPSIIDSGVARTEETATVENHDNNETNSSDSKDVVKVQVFQGGFKSNEDYTYIRGRGRGKFVCEECGIRCKKPSMLKKHIRTHTDFRPYYCKHCNFSFKTKGNLTKHMKSKAHLKKCLELGILPVPTTVDDSQIDEEALARQTAISKKAKILEDDNSSLGGDEDDDEEEENEDEDPEEDVEGTAMETDQDTNKEANILLKPELQEKAVLEGTSKMSAKENLSCTAPVHSGTTPSFVAVQSSKGDNPAFVQIQSSKEFPIGKSLGTVYGFPSKATKTRSASQPQGGDKTQDSLTNDDEIARSLLDLSKQMSETESNKVSSPDDTPGKGGRLDSLIGALMTRTTSRAQPTTAMCSSDQSAGDLQKHTLVPAQGTVRQPMKKAAEPVQVITIDSDSEDKSSSGDDVPRNVKGRNVPIHPVGKKFSSRPNILGLHAPKTVLSRETTVKRQNSDSLKPGFAGSALASSTSHSTKNSISTSIASVGPIIGQLIRQEPIKIAVTSGGAAGSFLAGVVPPFQFTHPFPGEDCTPIDRTKLTLPLVSGGHSGMPKTEPSCVLQDQLLMISPTKMGQNILHLVQSQARSSDQAQTPQGTSIGSLVGHIINVAGGSADNGSPSTQHILFQGASQGQSLLIPIPCSLTNAVTESQPTSPVASISKEGVGVGVTTPVFSPSNSLGSPAVMSLPGRSSHPLIVSALVSASSADTAKTPLSKQDTVPVTNQSLTSGDAGSSRLTTVSPIMLSKFLQNPEGQAHVIYVKADSSSAQVGATPTAFKVNENTAFMVDGRYVCTICKKTFQQQHQLTLHKNIHYFERRFRCEDCGVSFRTKGHLLKHYRSDSHLAKQSINTHFGVPTTDNPRPFKCSDCKVAFRNHGHLAKHLRSKMHITMLEKVGKLPSGTYAQIEKGSLNEIDASNCERTLESLHQMVDAANAATLHHIESIPRTASQDQGEGGSAMDYEALDDSENEDEGGLMIVESNASSGETCMSSMAVSPLGEHFNIPNRSPYEKFKAASNDKVTVEIKPEKWDFVEMGTGSSTPSRYGTGSDLEKGREGEVCGRSASPRFTSQINPAPDRPHKCGICRQGFKTLDFLNTHLITHAELRPYVCEYCDAGFTNGQSLKIHLQTHKRERPYVCGHCGDTFARADDLKTHHQNQSRGTHLPVDGKSTSESTVTETSAAPPASCKPRCGQRVSAVDSKATRLKSRVVERKSVLEEKTSPFGEKNMSVVKEAVCDVISATEPADTGSSRQDSSRKDSGDSTLQHGCGDFIQATSSA